MLVDEPETHLHPKWQRTILPSSWRPSPELSRFQIQLPHGNPFAAGPGLLEPIFDPPDRLADRPAPRWRTFRSRPRVPWRRRGDVSAWLTSEIFDLKSARSVEAEQALEEAAQMFREERADPRACQVARPAAAAACSCWRSRSWIRWRFLGRTRAARMIPVMAVLPSRRISIRTPGRKGVAQLAANGSPAAGRLPTGTVSSAFWRSCLADLHGAYRRICAYVAVEIPPIGAVSADHFVAKSQDAAQIP